MEIKQVGVVAIHTQREGLLLPLCLFDIPPFLLCFGVAGKERTRFLGIQGTYLSLVR